MKIQLQLHGLGFSGVNRLLRLVNCFSGFVMPLQLVAFAGA